MADEEEETKEPNRRKPFKRIKNSAYLVAEAVSAKGVACGCHTPSELGDIEAEFGKFMRENIDVLGPLLRAFDTVSDITHAVKDAIDRFRNAFKSIPVLGGLVDAIIGRVISPLQSIVDLMDAVAQIIKTATTEFLARIGARLVKRAIRLIPQWVPVKQGEPKHRITLEQIVEVEGVVLRSHGSPVGAPFAQWRQWMNWSVQVAPEPQYENLITAPITTNTVGTKSGETGLARGGFEIQWDTGALFDQRLEFMFQSGFPEKDTADADRPIGEPFNRWLWPQTGMYVWASGRWVFDCARTTDPESANPDMPAIMNPPRAMATATWAAVEFDENPLRPNSQLRAAVPAIRFMFVASNNGGYMDHPELVEEDYEFLLDLPELDTDIVPFPIQLSPDIDHNTIVLRPRLLQKVETLQDAFALKPDVDLVPPTEPNRPPTLAKVRIKAADLQKRGTHAFILNLGWHDPNLVRASEVKKCTVIVKSIEPFIQRDNALTLVKEMFAKELRDMEIQIREQVKKIHIFGTSLGELEDLVDPKNGGLLGNFGSEIRKMVDDAIDRAIHAVIETLTGFVGEAITDDEWLFRMGLNGNWRSFFKGDVTARRFDLDIGRPVFDVALGPKDELFFASSGVEFNAMGDMLRHTLEHRTFRAGQSSTDWGALTDAEGAELKKLAFTYALRVLAGDSEEKLTLGIENTMIGLVDPADVADDDPVLSNPLLVGGVEPIQTDVRRVAKFARAAPTDYILFQDGRDDYALTYELRVEDQIRKQNA